MVSPLTLMGPQAATDLRRWLIPLGIGFGALIICIAILSIALIYSGPEVRQVKVIRTAKSAPRQALVPGQRPPRVSPSLTVAAQATRSESPGPRSEKTVERPLKSVKDLIVEKSPSPAATPAKARLIKKQHALSRLKRRKLMQKRRKARLRRIRAAKKRRVRRARLARARKSRRAHAKKSRRAHATRIARAKRRPRASELDDLLSGL